MFEELKLLGPTEQSIIVQTRKGTSITNLIEVEPDESTRRKYRLLLDRFGQNWQERKPAVGVYNCAGHVWASRRTSILENKCWLTIFEDDGYRRLPLDEVPMSGDLAVWSDNQGDFLHVGMIMEMRPGVSPTSPPCPWVLSKWNSTSGEVLHYVQDAPFNKQDFPFTIEYWTDRPKP